MFDVHALRRQFPALNQVRGGVTPIFLDGPGGTQVPQRVIDAMVHYLSTCNSNRGGAFAIGVESDRIVDGAHAAAADLLNAPSPDEIVFGQNMTSLTLHLSRALSRILRPGDAIVVTRLDHDANVSPWVLAARDAGADVRWVNVRPDDCTLDLDDLRCQLQPGVRLVAVAAASNAVGTINDVAEIARLAHAAGALLFVDAVHYAPHGPIDVQAWDCDFLACSAYKFFGPHVGILWGRRSLLEQWPPDKVRPATDTIPGRWMTGTQNHEGLAGVTAAIDYLAGIGAACPEATVANSLSGRRRQIHAGLTAIRAYESGLCRQLLDRLAALPKYRLWGIAEPARLTERVPTLAVTLPDRPASAIAEHLAARQINTWSGNFYALGLTERLGLEQRGGFLRLGLVHYNTSEEIDRLAKALAELA